jgi:glyoxylase-like metal-dependent hydrolase (beta-lactamase superfamily II)
MTSSTVLVRSVLSGFGVLALGLGMQGAQGAAPAPAPAPPDFSKVEIVTTKLADNVYALDGQGGRITFLAGPDGVFVVDTQFAPLTDKIVAAIRQVSTQPIRFVVNTHVHGDHTGGDANFAKLGAVIISQDKLRARLASPPPAPAGAAPVVAPPAAALPILTYDTRLTLHMDGEEVEVRALPPAHTDGDTFVRLPKADVLATGDVFRSVGYPNIDRANGGTLVGMLAALNMMIDSAGPATKVVPGHGAITDRAALVAHRDMAVAVRDRVAKLMKEGKTVEQIVASKPTADFDQKTGNAETSADRFVQQLYAELAGPAR